MTTSERPDATQRCLMTLLNDRSVLLSAFIAIDHAENADLTQAAEAVELEVRAFWTPAGYADEFGGDLNLGEWVKLYGNESSFIGDFDGVDWRAVAVEVIKWGLGEE